MTFVVGGTPSPEHSGGSELDGGSTSRSLPVRPGTQRIGKNRRHSRGLSKKQRKGQVMRRGRG